jgi:hypothetical protein
MRPPLDPSGEQLAELLKLRGQAMALCASASTLAEAVRALIDERVPEPPGRRKRHLHAIPGPGAS